MRGKIAVSSRTRCEKCAGNRDSPSAFWRVESRRPVSRCSAVSPFANRWGCCAAHRIQRRHGRERNSGLRSGLFLSPRQHRSPVLVSRQPCAFRGEGDGVASWYRSPSRTRARITRCRPRESWESFHVDATADLKHPRHPSELRTSRYGKGAPY